MGKAKKNIKQYISKLTIIAILDFSRKLWKKYIKEYIINPYNKKKKKIYTPSIYVSTSLIIKVLHIEYAKFIIK